MIRERIIRSAVVALWAVLAGLGATGDAQPDDTRLSPGWLLVARPGMPDPNFRRTVVLLVRHGADGGFGLVLNRPLGSGPLAVLLDGLGVETEEPVDARIDLFLGGPVETERGFLIHSANDAAPSAAAIGDTGLSLSSDAALLGTIAEGEGPARYRLFLGYAGWGAGQLEAELDREDWLLAPAEADIVLTDSPAVLWETALKRAGMPL
jgi:putative transcriptional regulator